MLKLDAETETYRRTVGAGGTVAVDSAVGAVGAVGAVSAVGVIGDERRFSDHTHGFRRGSSVRIFLPKAFILLMRRLRSCDVVSSSLEPVS